MRLPQSAADAFVRFARKTTGDFSEITDKNYCKNTRNAVN